MAALSVLLGALNATNLANVTSGSNFAQSAGISPLAFVSPAATETTFNTSQRINVTWTTPFEFTTVEVYQGPLQDGSFVSDVIAANFSKDQTTLLWEAGAVQMANLSSPFPFQFRLQKGDQPNSCDACSLNSANFQVLNASAASSSSSSSSTATSTTTPATAAEASSAPSPMSTSNSRDERLGIGLGVGLGVGFLILILGVMLLALRRRKQRRQARERDLEEGRQLEAEADKLRHSSASELSGMTHKPFEFEKPDGTVREGWESLFTADGLRAFLSRKPTRKNPGRGANR